MKNILITFNDLIWQSPTPSINAILHTKKFIFNVLQLSSPLALGSYITGEGGSVTNQTLSNSYSKKLGTPIRPLFYLPSPFHAVEENTIEDSSRRVWIRSLIEVIKLKAPTQSRFLKDTRIHENVGLVKKRKRFESSKTLKSALWFFNYKETETKKWTHAKFNYVLKFPLFKIYIHL